MSDGWSRARSNEESADDRVDALQVEAMLFDVPPAYTHDTHDTCISCRICLDSECSEDDRLLSPCRCSGTMKYVHASCLDRWRGFAQRTQSVVGCDQCGAEYRFASTPLMRLLSSRIVLWAATALAFVAVVLLTGITGSALMRHYQPELFVGSHPYLVQSSQYRPTLDHVPLRLRALQEERHASYVASGLENFWDYMLGPIEDAYVDDDDEDGEEEEKEDLAMDDLGEDNDDDDESEESDAYDAPEHTDRDDGDEVSEVEEFDDDDGDDERAVGAVGAVAGGEVDPRVFPRLRIGPAFERRRGRRQNDLRRAE